RGAGSWMWLPRRAVSLVPVRDLIDVAAVRPRHEDHRVRVTVVVTAVLDGAHERELRSVDRPGRLRPRKPAADPRDPGAVGIHERDFVRTETGGNEREPRAVRLPCGTVVVSRIGREPDEARAVGMHGADVDVPGAALVCQPGAARRPRGSVSRRNDGQRGSIGVDDIDLTIL